MGHTSAVDYLSEYQQAVKQHRLVIVLFKSQYCQACLGLDARFKRVASQYTGQVKSLILDTETISKVDGIEGTPTIQVFKDGEEVENLRGIGDPPEQEALLEELFSLYTQQAALSAPLAHP